MTEAEAQAYMAERFGVDAVALLARFVALVVEENERQNLISPASLEHVWVRHVLDSVQLIPLGRSGEWLDVGTGGGFPGMVVAILRHEPMLLVEPRRKRAAFLEQCREALGLDHVRVVVSKVEAVSTTASVISARAVASVENLLLGALPCAKVDTRWLLPRGRFGTADLEQLRQRWAGVFHVEQSLTDPESSILVLDGVRRQ